MSPTQAGNPEQRKRARNSAYGLYAIIVFKLVKGVLLLLLALGVYSLIGDDLPEQFGRVLRAVRIDPEREFFEDLAGQLASISPATVGWIALGTGFYALFSIVEAIGLLARADWAGWLAIGESGFFVPIEAHHLVRHFSPLVLGILIVNVLIVVYLVRNRSRLLAHHHRRGSRARP